MIINYKPQEQELEIGRPYTFGIGYGWFMRVSQTEVVLLVSVSEPCGVLDARSTTEHLSLALTWTGFRYATSMEIK